MLFLNATFLEEVCTGSRAARVWLGLARYASRSEALASRSGPSLTKTPHHCLSIDGFAAIDILISQIRIMASNNGYRVSKSTRRMQTCDICRARHQKCNGAKPQCIGCELRGVHCSYGNVTPEVLDRASRSAESAVLVSKAFRSTETLLIFGTELT